jgi:GWxTD domain-containing protein
MRRSIIPLAVVAVLTGAFVAAELSQTYKDWPTTPAGYLLTQAERKEYSKLEADAEAQAFIDLFWAKRDPDLKTLPNEFKLDFEQRVAAADKMFSTDKVKGSMTDRGRVLILLGMPTGQSTVPRNMELAGSRPEQERGDAFVWVYKKSAIALVQVKVDEIRFNFVESSPGAKDFPLDRFNMATPQANKVLGEMPEALIRNPKLKEVPRAGLVPGSKAATTAQLTVLDTQPRPWPEGTVLHVVSGVQSEVMRPIWIHLQLADAVPAATLALGRVRRVDNGAEVGTFALDVAPLSIAGARAYELALPVDAGSYKVEVAVANEAGPVAIGEAAVTIDPSPADGTVFSQFYWGASITQEPTRALGDAFNIGGWRVLPRVTNTYVPSEELSYFCYVVRPGLNESQKPALQLGMKLFVNDKPAGELPPAGVNLSRVLRDLWMFGNALPLSNFTKPGDYRLELTLIDTIAGAKTAVAIAFKMAAPTPVAAPAAAAAPAAPTTPAAKP